MGADTRLAVVLFGSFVLWIPALGSVLRGELDIGAAGLRWTIAAVLVWIVVTGLNQLIGGYAVAATKDDGPEDGGPRSRRMSDLPGAGAGADEGAGNVESQDTAATTACIAPPEPG